MAVFKRTSKKTGNGSRRTTTLSTTNGKTQSYSNKPSAHAPRRTVSHNSKTGKIRTTTTQKLGGGYTKVTSKTIGGNHRISGSKIRVHSGKFSDGFGIVIPLIVLGGITMYFWPVTIPFILLTVASIVAIVVVYKLACLLFGLVYKLVLFLCKWIVVIGVLSGLVYILYTLLTHYL